MPAQTSSTRLLRRPEVLSRIGIKTATLYAWMDKTGPAYKPDFPKPYPLSHDKRGRATMVAWRESDIARWVESVTRSGVTA